MKIATWVLALLTLTSHLAGETVIQTGLESFFGPNRMVLWSPWLGVRHGLSPSSSLLLKCYFHNLQYRYIGQEEMEVERLAHLLNVTGAYYRQTGAWEYYGALSLLTGTEGYSALALDAGAARRFLKRLTVEGGLYLMNESSILWHPEEARKRISLASLKAGVRLEVFHWLRLFARANVYRSTDRVTASMLAAGLVIVPGDPVFLSLGFSTYTESASYRFKGDYLEVALNYYR